MHNYYELAHMSAVWTLRQLAQTETIALKNLEIGSATSDIKCLQMINMQKAIIAVGLVSIFESIVQNEYNCESGQKFAKDVLTEKGEQELLGIYSVYCDAINVLKHGRGRSYNKLVANATTLPFKVKQPNEYFFFEGDVSEVSTLIEVDNKFVIDCSNVITQVSEKIKQYKI